MIRESSAVYVFHISQSHTLMAEVKLLMIGSYWLYLLGRLLFFMSYYHFSLNIIFYPERKLIPNHRYMHSFIQILIFLLCNHFYCTQCSHYYCYKSIFEILLSFKLLIWTYYIIIINKCIIF